MDIKILWRLDFKLEVNEDGKNFQRTKLDKPRWIPFDLDDILFHSRDYAILLFSNGTPVIIKETNGGGTRYIVNKDDLLKQYQSAGKNVMLLKDCKPSTESVEKVGFWG